MAVPDLSGPLISIRNIQNTRSENAKTREHERDQALKQFGYSIGLKAFDTISNVGVKAFDEYQNRPYELADRGVFEGDLPELPESTLKVETTPNPNPLPDEPASYTTWGDMQKQPLGGRTPPPTLPQPEYTPGRKMQVDGGGNMVPLEPDVNPLDESGNEQPWESSVITPKPTPPKSPLANPDAWKQSREAAPRPLGSESGPSLSDPPPRKRVLVPQEGEGMIPGDVEVRDRNTGKLIYKGPPGPPAAGDLPQTPPGMFDEVATSRVSSEGQGQLLKTLQEQQTPTGTSSAADEKLKQQLAQMSSKDRAFYEAAMLRRRRLEAEIGFTESQTAKNRQEVDPARIKAEMDKLGAETDRARVQALDFQTKVDKAKLAKTPGSREYETLRGKAWEQAALISQRLETRTSGSTSVGGGGAGGGLSVSLGGSSKKPLFKVKIVDDGNGWPRIVGPSGDGRYLFRDENGNILDYSGKTIQAVDPNTGEGTDTSVEVTDNRTGRAPAPAPKREQPKTPTAPTAPTRPGMVTPLLSRTPEAPPGGKGNPFAGQTDEDLKARQNDLGKMVRGNPAKSRKQQEEFRDISAELTARKDAADKATKAAAEAERAANKQKGSDKEEKTYLNDLTSLQARVKPSVPRTDEEIQKAGFIKSSVMDGYYKVPGVEKGIFSAEKIKSAAADPDKAIAAGNKALVDQLKLASREKRLSALREKLPGLRKQYGLAGRGATREDFFRDVSPVLNLTPEEVESLSREGVIPPGPSTTTPGQLPPPPGRQTQADPADDLFDKINAMPWSADRKRRVYMTEAKKRGLA